MAKTATGTQPPAQQTMQQMAEAAMAQSRQMTQANPAAQALKERKERLKTMVKADSVVEQFRNALGRHSDTFVASIIDLYNSDSDLQQCNPTQVVQEALKAATLRLPINKQLGFAYIIAYNNSKPDGEGGWLKVKEPSFQIGYKGYIQLAMRSGQYEILNPDVVYEGELRRRDKLTGEIDFGGERTSDKIIGYFCHERLVNGFRKTLYMSVEEVAAHAKRYSKALKNNANVTVASLIKLAEQPFNPNSDKVGWLGNFHSMALKTVVRQLLSKYGYLSIEMNEAMAKDIDGDSSVEPPTTDAEFSEAVVLDAAPAQIPENVDPATGEIVNTPAEGQQAEAVAEAAPTATAKKK